MLNITISIGDVETEMTTDQNLSFDAIESLLNRAVQHSAIVFVTSCRGSSCELRNG